MRTVNISLCMGSSCHSRGNAALVDTLNQWAKSKPDLELKVTGSLCLGRCTDGPVVVIDGEYFTFTEPGELQSLLEKILCQGAVPQHP